MNGNLDEKVLMMKSNFWQSGDIAVNTDTREVWLSGERINLPKLTYRFLLVLLENADKCVSFEQLITEVWQHRSVGDDTIAQRASLLRKSLAQSSVDYIETVRGEGYRWCVPVSRSQTLPKPEQKSRWRFGVGTLVVLLITTIAVWLQRVSMEVPEAATGVESTASNPSSAGQTLDKSEFAFQRAEQYRRAFNGRSNRIAIDLYRTSLEQQPEHVAAKMGLAISLLHQVSKFNGASGLLIEADQLTAELLANQPQRAQVVWLRAFYFDVSGHINAAIEGYETALALAPDSLESKGALAYLYVQKGRLHEALHLNIDTLGSKQQYQLLQIAECLMLAQLPELAQQWFINAKELAPDNILATVGLARFYFTQDQWQQARALLEALHEQGLGSSDSYLLLAQIAVAQGQLNVAEQLLAQGQALKPDSYYVYAWQRWLAATQQQPWLHPSPLLQPLSDDDWPNLWVAQAVIEMANNDQAQALRALQKAYQLGYRNARMLERLTPLLPLLQSPSFQSILNKMNTVAISEQIKMKGYALDKLTLKP
ncbi:MAG: winged helix-turn-helix domain-containing protein [Gammaproteobacteria bacterium]|nr:winged helix-turn-helix domain-containing protein [Gammaproteobacteria bacterium]